MRVFLAVCLLAALQPLLIGAGVLARWVIECGSGACAGTVRATSPVATARDLLLTMLAATLTYLLAGLAAVVTWLLAASTAPHAAAPSLPVRPAHPRAAPSAPAAVGTAENAGMPLPALPPRITPPVTGYKELNDGR